MAVVNLTNGAALGASPPAAALSTGADEETGTITLTAGASGTTAGTLCTFNTNTGFSDIYGRAEPVVHLTAASSAAAGLGLYCVVANGISFTVGRSRQQPTRSSRSITASTSSRGRWLPDDGAAGPVVPSDTKGAPMAFTTITISGGPFTRPDGGYAEGTFTVTLSEALANGAAQVDPTPISGMFVEGMLKNATGEEPFTAVATDDSATSPVGAEYSAVLQLDSAPIRQGSFVLSHLAADGTVDLDVLLPPP
jgi:hypothetical protein